MVAVSATKAISSPVIKEDYAADYIINRVIIATTTLADTVITEILYRITSIRKILE
jgi:hypothetical protein